MNKILILLVALFSLNVDASKVVIGKGSAYEYSRDCGRSDGLQRDQEQAKEQAIADAQAQCGSEVQLISEWEFAGAPGCWDVGHVTAEAKFSCVEN
jgi:hypothetical protein